MKNEEKKIIPLKNYIVVVVMFMITIIAVFGLRAWFRNYKEYKLTIPIISGKIQEININEFDAFITEHDDFFVYIGTATDEKCRNIESDLIDLLEKRSIKNDTIYLNMSNKTNDRLIDKLKNYGYKENDISYPMFLMIKDKKIIEAILDLNIWDIEKLLDQYEIGD